MGDDDAEAAAPGPESPRTAFDRRWPRTSLAVVEAVAVARDVDPFALAPLGATLDAAALAELMQASVEDCRIETTFTYGNCRIVVRNDGTVQAETLSSGTDTETRE